METITRNHTSDGGQVEGVGIRSLILMNQASFWVIVSELLLKLATLLLVNFLNTSSVSTRIEEERSTSDSPCCLSQGCTCILRCSPNLHMARQYWHPGEIKRRQDRGLLKYFGIRIDELLIQDKII